MARWRGPIAAALTAALLLPMLGTTPVVAQSDAVPDPVTAYAPLVYLHPNEDLLPYRVDLYVPQSELWWNRDGRTCDAVLKDDHALLGVIAAGGYSENIDHHDDCTTDTVLTPWTTIEFAAPGFTHPSDRRPLGEKAEGFYLDVPDDDPDDILGGSPIGKAPSYYEYEPGRFIIYWFFYARNEQGPNRHDGDWEHIVVRLDPEDRATDVAYYQHECAPVLKRWAEVERDGDHPVVYSALGSHASYWEPRSPSLPVNTDCVLPDIFDEAEQSDKVWRTWQGAGLVEARAEPWYRYGGIWGEPFDGLLTTNPDIIGRFSTGGLGPSVWRFDGYDPVIPEGWDKAQPPIAIGPSGKPLSRPAALR